MKIYIKRRIKLNDVVFSFILCLALLSSYFGGAAVGFAWASLLWNAGIMAMFLAVLLDYSLYKKFDKTTLNILLVGGMVFILFLAINFSFGKNRGFARSNLMTIIKVIVAEMSIMMFARSPRTKFFDKLKNCFWLFNVWGILNMIVLTIQINIKGFLMPSAWLSMNSYYEDLCAGLFGYNGTHRLSIYMTFLFLYNQYTAEFETKRKGKKRRLYIYNYTLLTWHFILSTQNDNMTIYILTVVFFAAYVYLDTHWQNHSLQVNIVKWSKYVLVGVFTVGVVLFIPSTREFIIEGVVERILKLTAVTSSTGSGSTERLSILLYSFENGFGYGLGNGIGYYPFGGNMETNASIGFRHFGLSNMSSMIFLMGVWFYLFFTIWVSKIYQSLSRENDKILLMVILLLTLFLTFYTTNLTSTPMSVCLMLIFSTFGMMEEAISSKRILENK